MTRSIIFGIILILSSCKDNSIDNAKAWGDDATVDSANAYVEFTGSSLEGTLWQTDFYYFTPYIYFETDSTGFSQKDGVVKWGDPIDTNLHDITVYVDSLKWQHQCFDSLTFDMHFKYKFKDSTLVLKYVPTNGENKSPETYRLRKIQDKIFFVSDIPMHTKIMLSFKKNIEPGAIIKKSKEVVSENFTVRPLPGYGSFSINSKTKPSYTIEVFDLKGEKVYQSEVLVGTSKMDLSSKPKGKYRIRISFNDGSFEKEIELK